ncbi:MAG TPA: hypothetical protein VGM03_14775 [Phycisphaerae bacterium]|jgi:hypothetical protein
MKLINLRRRLYAFVFATLACAGRFAPLVWAQTTITITPPTEDAFVREAAPTFGYGSAGGLNVSGAAAVNLMGVPMGRFDSVLKFNSSAAVQQFNAQYGAGNWTLSLIRLRVSEVAAPNNPIFNVGLGMFEVRWLSNDDWTEGFGSPTIPSTPPPDSNAMTWNYLQTLLGMSTESSLGTFSNTLISGNHFYTLSNAAAFVSDLNSGGPVSLHMLPVTSTIGFTFRSSSYLSASLRPALQLTAVPVPEPATLPLLAAIFLLPRGRRPSKGACAWTGGGRILPRG